ncbi:hypothetical protein DOTSEDRAFT_173635 [Dothistroma septosporum NZE10]|uniref:DUF3533 domain-containing protein n=1 Tax=Dothistroma septosporum (strain NZE10 / CBS 128990) TaxID=675120 RepID=M2YM99_DOTSN|nr:hypothetical protein DOTSEDRAFT_173635 [Dothistroma septosporum NZE10]
MAPAARLDPHDPYWNGKRRPFIIGVCFVFILLQLLFLADLSYLYGVVFRSGDKAHNLHILNVNLDANQSIVQQSISAAYSRLTGADYLELESRPSSEYSSIEAARSAVCRGDYWAAIVVNEGASERLSDALAGGAAANSYNSSQAVTLIYNTAKYSSITLGDIIGNLQTLVGAASVAHASIATDAITTLNTTSAAAVNAFRSPISSTAIDIMPTNQGSRVLYNTVSMVFPIIQQFFFLMAVNGLSSHYKLYTSLQVPYALLMRGVLSTIYTFISSLCMTGYIWAFCEGWAVDAGQFGLTWMVLWLYMFINFGILDAVTGFIPMSFVPFFIITWVVINVGSTISPLALMPGFYHWGVALPAHNTYNVLVNVWTSGCNPPLHQYLPILFAWAVLGVILANMGMYQRCNAAAKAEAEQEEAFQKRISASQSRETSANGSRAGLEKAETAGTMRRISDAPYPQDLRAEVSRIGVRMPFADTVERFGSGNGLERSTTA